MSRRAEPAPAAARRPPRTPRPRAPRPPGWRCAPQRGLRRGSRHQPEAFLIPSPPLRQADFLRVTNPQISKGGAQPPARRLSIRGTPGRAWTFVLTILRRARPRTPPQGFSENQTLSQRIIIPWGRGPRRGWAATKFAPRAGRRDHPPTRPRPAPAGGREPGSAGEPSFTF